jgi:hypothetical protein
MILPTKYVPASDSTIGLAGALLSLRTGEQTVSNLWSNFIGARPDSTFDRFAEALTLLNLMGLVTFDRGLLEWAV